MKSRWPGWAALGRMRVGHQLVTAFGLLLGLAAVLGVVALLAMARMDARSAALADKWLRGVGHLADLRTAVVELRDLEMRHSHTSDASYHAEYEDKMGLAARQAAASLQAYAQLPAAAADAALLATLDKAVQAYRQASERVVKLGRAKQQQDAADISDGLASMSFDEAQGALAALTQFNFEGGRAAAADAAATYAQARRGVVALLLLTLGAGLVLALLITRRLLGQLGGEPATAVCVAKAVAAGDLSTPIVLRAGDTHSLMASLLAMQRGLAAAVTQVRRGAQSVASASGEIAAGNHDLEGRTEQQASVLQQTAATMEQLGGTVQHNAANAQQASQLAQGAAAVAVKGGAAVTQVVVTMRGINESSHRIADILSVIDGIAFQTNILALNAAVEAARAGEQGRGFAVVAGEVRGLAQRSAAAAREIKALIGASIERVQQGSAQVDEAGQRMTEIVAAIRHVSEIVARISAASTEQSQGVGQVGEAVSHMDQATQQNAALVEQSAAAAESLRLQAQQLVEAVAVFKIA